MSITFFCIYGAFCQRHSASAVYMILLFPSEF